LCDPKGKKEADKVLPGYKWFDSPYQAAKGSHLIVILTEWNEFRALDLNLLSKDMETPLLADLRNIYSRNEALQNGFANYISVGRE